MRREPAPRPAASRGGPAPVVVGGEALVDLLVGPDGSMTWRAGGGPFNVARTVARLGVEVAFLGRLSDDRFGQAMRRSLAGDGVRLACPDPVEAPTTLAVAELDASGGARYRFHLAGTAGVALTVDDTAAVAVADVRALHLGTLGLAVDPSASALEAYLERVAGEALVMVDPNCRPGAADDETAYRARLGRILRRADVVKVSRDDLAFLAPGVASREAAAALLGGRTRAVLLTDGGAAVHALGAGAVTTVPVPTVTVVDTVGAGDAFGGAFLAWWLGHGHPLHALEDRDAVRDAVEAAVEVAARTCERAGADPPRLDELVGPTSRWAA